MSWLAPVNPSLVCFRLNDGRQGEEELEKLNRELLDRVYDTGRVFLTYTSLRGRLTIRMAIGQRSTCERHVRRAWDFISREAARLTGEEG